MTVVPRSSTLCGPECEGHYLGLTPLFPRASLRGGTGRSPAAQMTNQGLRDVKQLAQGDTANGSQGLNWVMPEGYNSEGGARARQLWPEPGPVWSPPGGRNENRVGCWCPASCPRCTCSWPAAVAEQVGMTVRLAGAGQPARAPTRHKRALLSQCGFPGSWALGLVAGSSLRPLFWEP